MRTDFETSYWTFAETVRNYDLNSLMNYYSEVLADIGETHVGSRGSRILDIGCAYGYFMQLCLRRGYDCVGLDISRWALSKATGESVKVILCDASKALPLQSNSIEIVTMLDVIEHLDNPQLALTEIRRVLKPKGILFISTPNLAAIIRGIKGQNWYGFLDKTHVSLFTPSHLSRLLKKCDFNILRCYAPFDVNSLSGARKRGEVSNVFKICESFLVSITKHILGARLGLGGQIRVLANKI